MQPAKKPDNELTRLVAAVHAGVLDTEPDPQFDDLVQLAATICQTPIALISFIGHETQFLKARVGINQCSTTRDVAFCAHTILQQQMMVVPDTLLDERFHDHPCVIGDPNIRFYAGMPVFDNHGHALGSICVIDRVPRQLNPSQIQALEVLARQVQVHLEVRRVMRLISPIEAAFGLNDAA
jgi:GAF domain-containing protein